MKIKIKARIFFIYFRENINNKKREGETRHEVNVGVGIVSCPTYSVTPFSSRPFYNRKYKVLEQVEKYEIHRNA